jgi:hypothetical protein
VLESEKVASAAGQRMYHSGLTGMSIYLKTTKYLGQASRHRNILRATTKEFKSLIIDKK